MIKVLAIGHGRNLFVDGDDQCARLQNIACEVESLDQIIFTTKRDGLQSKKVTANFTLHPTNSANKLTMIFDAIRIGSRLVKEKKIDVVTAQDPFEAGLVGVRLKQKTGVRLQVQEHGDFFSELYWRQESLLNRVRYWIGIFVLNRADIVRVVAKRIEATLRKKTKVETDIRVLPVAIDVERYLPKQARTAPRAGETFQLLSVARFVPQKNILLMLEAFAKALQQNDKLHLTLVGRGSQGALIESRIQTLNLAHAITMLDWSDDVPGLMHNAHAYILSSNYEGWGRVLIEALANQLPVITTDVGCAGEVTADGVHGIVVPTNDVKQLAAAIVRLSTDQSVYQHIQHSMATIDTSAIPGADSAAYATAWVQTLSPAAE